MRLFESSVTMAFRTEYRLALASLLVALVCFLLVLVTGCRPDEQATETHSVPVTFESLCGFPREQFGVAEAETVRRSIEEEYGETPLETTVSASVTMYIWEYEGMTGNAYVRDGQLLRISLHDVADGPRFGQVVEDLGAPEMVYGYQLSYEQVLYTVGLDYPTLGVSVFATGVENRRELTHGTELAITLTPDMRVNSIHCYVPGSMESVLREAFLLSPESVAFQMQRRIPWPGFEALIPLNN